jgi:hypothetical protein
MPSVSLSVLKREGGEMKTYSKQKVDLLNPKWNAVNKPKVIVPVGRPETPAPEGVNPVQPIGLFTDKPGNTKHTGISDDVDDEQDDSRANYTKIGPFRVS